jgi:protein gp37
VDRRDPHVPELLEQPLKWKRPRRIFVNSMSDLFHEDVHDDFIDRVLSTIRRCEVAGKSATRSRSSPSAPSACSASCEVY